ncbi:MAG: hypothetical protein JNK76_04620 [Planctomycetales bacterium]|nr:hypothetical protein [Planctomycetales bacterium]MBN8628370.1 hypothetical protein [Planctomycetota bacterium]
MLQADVLQACLRTDLQGRLRAEVLQARLLQEAQQLPEGPVQPLQEVVLQAELLRADLCRRRTDLRLRRSGRRSGSGRCPEGPEAGSQGPGSEG